MSTQLREAVTWLQKKLNNPVRERERAKTLAVAKSSIW